MKKMIFIAILALTVNLMVAPAAHAEGITGWLSDFKDRLIKPFNYEKVVVPVPVAKAVPEPVTVEPANCLFTRTMGVGATGSDVAALQLLLAVPATGEYDELTASALVGYQEANAAAILKPLGLTHGTGYLGQSTLNYFNGQACSLPAKAQ